MLDRLFRLETVYVLSGIVLIVIACFSARDRTNPARYGTALFWLLLGVVFALGSVLPFWVTGVLVLALVALDGLGLVRQGKPAGPPLEEKRRSADRLGYLLFVPVLTIPALTALAYAAARFLAPTLEPNRVLYVSLGLSAIPAAAGALAITRARPATLFDEGRRLADAIGAVVILPQLLASLGELFAAAGVGRVIAGLVRGAVPTDSLFAVVLVLCATIALFTFLVGNSFAAFPVIMGGIGVPLLVEPFGADPAIVGALTITVASCGTLCTPMAANFNIVPAALFEMKDRYGLIRFQAPFAGAMFVVHVLLMWGLLRFGVR
jgi:uncharacterized membrane protein